MAVVVIRSLHLRMGILLILFMTMIGINESNAADAATAPKPPVAKKVAHVTEIHGMKLTDDYFWLREKANPEVRAYLE